MIDYKVKKKEGFFYFIFYKLFQSSFLYLYRSITILGKENFPKDESCFIAPNHQNSMMDAMAILFTRTKPHPYFVARADIFRKRFIAWVLHSLKMFPIFRIRDGKDNLQNNDEIFEKTVKVLSENVPFTIYTEGNHAGFRRFRGVKKGIARTALMALSEFPKGKKLYIIPTGIEYNTSYEKAMQNIVVYYGKPLCVNDFFELYQEDKARGERHLQVALNERMSDQMIDIQTKEYYELYDIVRESACGEVMNNKGVKRSPGQKLYAQQEVIKSLNKSLEEDEKPFAQLQENAKKYKQLLKTLKLRDWLFDKEHYSGGKLFGELLAAIILFPIAFYGRVTNALQFAFINHMANKNKDPQWRSSVRYVMGFTFLAITHLILAASVFFFVEKSSGWWYLAAVLSMAYGGKISLHYEVWVKKIFGRMRYNKLMRKPNATFKELKSYRQEFNDFVLKNL